MDPDSEIVFDFPPFLRLYKSGRVHRLIGTDYVPAGVDPATGVASKDVVIDPRTGLSARLYVCCPSASTRRPILFYLHGGAFVAESAFSPTYHAFLNNVVAKADVVAVSVEYRRAPEDPLPAAYDDAFAALRWVASGGGGEPWLAERGDFDRVFLAGDSAGANIAHNILVRTRADPLEIKIAGLALIHTYFWGKEAVGAEPTDPAFREWLETTWGFVCGWSAGIEDPLEIKIAGLALIHTYFWGKEAVGAESTDPAFREWLETTWGFVCGWSAGIEDPRVDPFRDEAALRALPCRRVLVSVTDKDLFRERGKAYYERLRASGWEGEAELVETEGEEHVYFLSNPNCEKASAEMARLVAFLTHDS